MFLGFGRKLRSEHIQFECNLKLMESKLFPRPILFVNRRSDGNIGDAISSPLNYFRAGFNFTLPQEIHVAESKRRIKIARILRDSAEAIVIGGGGLIGQDFFKRDLEFWAGGPAPLILWGAGHNSHDIYSATTSVPMYEDYGQLSYFALIGVRDYGLGFNWVPCSSCMSEEMTRPSDESKGTVFAFHRDGRSDDTHIQSVISQVTDPHIIYNDCSAAEFYGTLRSAKTIVTNSFHAAYLGSLLKKPVVAIGGGSKMLALKHRVPIAKASEWKSALSEVQIHPSALEECRDANADFARRVFQFTGRDQAKRKPRPYIRDPLTERANEEAAQNITYPAIVKNKVPKVIHFIFGLSPDFGGKPFNIMHKIAILSAIKKIKPEEVIFHYHYKPSNDIFRDVEGLMTLNKIEIPEYYNGNPLIHFAHKADIIRMSILKDFGGIYLDLDTVTVDSFDYLLNYSFTIGLQGRSKVDGLCNAVILSAPNDPFICDWLSIYDRFSGQEWDKFSVRLPYAMWRSGKWSINVQPYDKFHWPYWDDAGLKMMFEEKHNFNNSVCHHLWESYSFKKYFSKYSDSDAAKHIIEGNSTYSALSREYL